MWQKLVEMYDEGQGRRVWEPESPIQGRVIALDLALTDMAVDQGIKGALYGVVWTCEARRLPKRTQASRMATTGADPDQPDPITVHVLTAAEEADLQKRMLGPLLQAVVDHEAEHGEHATKDDHPVQKLLAECKARRNTKLTHG